MHLLRQLPPTVDVVRAEAEAIHIGRSTSAAEGCLVDDAGKVYAHATCGLVALGG